jgi:predicted SnoaL-like aldol condensation-catalyzing enzyme
MNTYDTAIVLYSRWGDMWNGDLDAADEIISDHFVAHLTADSMPPPQEIKDPTTVKLWVGKLRSSASRLRYEIIQGPIVQNDMMAVYWQAIAERENVAIRKVGVDFLRFSDQKITECWTMNNNAL